MRAGVQNLQAATSSVDLFHSRKKITLKAFLTIVNMQGKKVPSLPLLIGGVIAILLGTSGFAAVTTWMQASTNEAGIVLLSDELPPPPTALLGALAARVPVSGEGDTRPTVKCAGCGVIASTRETRQLAAGIDAGTAGGQAGRGPYERPGESTISYEVTVRMNDGSSRVFTDPNRANWRPGQRVLLVEGKSHLHN